jgi:hypothetical protein
VEKRHLVMLAQGAVSRVGFYYSPAARELQSAAQEVDFARLSDSECRARRYGACERP